MQKTSMRFKYCDERFYPYLDKVFERLPQEVRNQILDDESFQIMADEGFHEACVLRYDFKAPLKTLFYFNTKGLKEPEHRIVHTIAAEIARHLAQAAQTSMREKEMDDLLTRWGFENEVEAVRYDQAIAESEGYRIGYGWALKQSKDYLLQHFGIFFDQWNEKGLGKITREQIEMLHDRAGTATVLDEARTDRPPASASEPRLPVGEMSQRKAMIAGIMAAVKEIILKELYSAKTCATRAEQSVQGVEN